MKRFRLNMDRRHMLEGYTFVLPFLLGAVAFFLFPLYISIQLSFGKVNRLAGFELEWSGLQHYRRALFLDVSFVPLFLQVVNRALINTPLIVIFALILSVFVNKGIRFKGFFRVVFFIPFLLGTGHVMRQLLNMEADQMVIPLSDGSLVPRDMLVYLGSRVISAVDTLFGTIVVVLWSSGVQMLLLLSGLQNIPSSLYESAKMDGANEWEMLWKITLPLISPILLLAVIYTIVDSFAGITNPLLEHIRFFAFELLHFEFAAAMGWIYFMFVIAVVLTVIGLFRKSMDGAEGRERRRRRASKVG